MERENRFELQQLLESFRDIVYDLENKKDELLYQIEKAYKHKDELSQYKECLLTILFNESYDELYFAISKIKDFITTLENLLEGE